MHHRSRIVLALCAASVAVVVVLCALPAIGSASSDPGLEVTQAIYDGAGQPAVGANFAPDGHLATATWWICQPASDCVQASSTGWLTSVPVASGTIFEARAEYQGRTYVAHSPTWNGPLTAVTRPYLKGRPVVGRTVQPIGAHWAGGWARSGDYSFLHVEACRTANARRCVTLSAEGEDYPGRGAPPVVTARYVGWYLFAIDARYSRDSVFGGVGYRTAEGIPPVQVGSTVIRSRALGPVRSP